jgi:D-lactate dehydrogenase
MDLLRDITKGKTPKWSPYIPKSSKFAPEKFLIDRGGQKVVYFPSCICRTFGNQRSFADEPELYEIVNILINRAGYEIVIPKNVENLCCGTPMSSKGYKDEAKKQLDELKKALLEATNNGEYPVLCETSPCVKAMIKGFGDEIKVYEPIEFTLKFLANRLEFHKIDEPIAIHSTCSTRNLSLEEDFVKLAKMCSDTVIVPQNVTCCGFAGDRGFTHPELNAKALRWLKHDIKGAKEGFSTSITCEIGLNQHGEIPYKSILYLVERVTRRKK